jgi:steroid delta-isomerase-like uncharacterized protein
MEQTRENLEEHASDVLARWYAAWNAHDVDAVSALMVEDVRYEDPAAPEPTMSGRPAVEGYMRSAFRGLPDLYLDMLEEWTTPGGGIIASYFRITATFKGPLAYSGRPTIAPTGRRIEALGMDRSEIRDGLVARHQIFWDQAEVGRQNGLLPPRGSVGERIAVRIQNLAAKRIRARR